MSVCQWGGILCTFQKVHLLLRSFAIFGYCLCVVVPVLSELVVISIAAVEAELNHSF